MQNRETYLDTVCSEIKFRAARKVLRQELEDHIEDRKAELEKNDLPDAEAAAIEAMGDAKEIGKALNAIHRPRTEWGIPLCVLLLSLAGLYINQVSGFAYNSLSGTGYFDFSFLPGDLMVGMDIYRAILLAAVGLSVLAVAYFSDYSWLLHLRHALFFAALLYITIRLYLIKQNNIDIYGFFGQTAPINITTMLFILSIPGFIKQNIEKGMKGMVHIVLAGAISIAALYFLSSVYASVLGAAYIVIFGLSLFYNQQPATYKWRRIAIVSSVMSIVFVVCVLLIQPDRFAFGTSFNGPDYKGWVIREVLSDSKFIGAAMIRTYNTTGYILTTVISTYGWLVGISFVLAFALLLTLMLLRSRKIAHTFGRLLSFSISAYFCARFMLFLLANFGVIGGTSVNLPFVSYGWFSLTTDLFLVGIFMSVWRRSSFMTKEMHALKKSPAL